MTNEPDAVEGYVAFETDPNTPTFQAPHEAEALAMSLLGAASEARAQEATNEAEKRTYLQIAANARHSRDRGFPVGHAEPDEEYRHTSDGTRYRKLWINGPLGTATWHIPERYVPSWCEAGPVEGEPAPYCEEELLAHFAGLSTDDETATNTDPDDVPHAAEI